MAESLTNSFLIYVTEKSASWFYFVFFSPCGIENGVKDFPGYLCQV